MELVALTACGGAAALSLVLRFRRSRGVERQQLKWFTYAGALMASLFVVDEFLPDSAVSSALFAVALSLVPVAAGIAILRYRLYESTTSSGAHWSTPCLPRSSRASMPARSSSLGVRLDGR